MPRRNGIRLILALTIGLRIWASASAQNHPLVVGFERFHSETPSIEGGRILFNELGCVNCHDHETGLPERKGPNLAGITQRSHPDWIRPFLKNSSETNPGTNMPQIHLEHQEIEAVLHFLASTKPKKTIPNAFRFVNAERGMALYHEFGCVACHEPSPDFFPADGKPDANSFTYPNIPLTDLNKKYDFDSLSAFLYAPHDYWPQGRMPKFKLEREDGGDLAAHLLDYQNGDSYEYPPIPEFTIDPTLALAGKNIISSKNCVACHNIPGTENLTPGRPTKISSGKAQSKEHPQYNLTQNQTQSINLFLGSKQTQAPALSQLQSLNCLACHDRNGVGGPDTARKVFFAGNRDLGDTGRYPPPLTQVGRKLQAEWLDAAVKGQKKMRPYLKTQMPDFGESVKQLCQILIREDKTPTELKQTPGDIEVGRKLLGTLGGLNCITCHDWGERRSLGIRSLDLSTMAARLQPNWLHHYLINPGHYRPNTLMPSFWPNGIASNQSILDGDTAAQIASIYAFSKSGTGLPEGFPEEDTAEYEIIPTDRPVVQRSFFEGVGTHALLVGFPEGIHLAFDGQSGEPAILWKGRFFDAYRTWYSRFPEFENPLGKEAVLWPESEYDNTRTYRGYRLDGAGIPEFVLTMNGVDYYERYIPTEDEKGNPGMQRVIRYTRESQFKDPRLRHPKSVTTLELKDDDPMTRRFIYQW